MSIADANKTCESVLNEIQSSVVADEGFLENVLVGALSRGHILIEDVPGTGKTLTAKLFAEALGLSFNRIQFTPDLLPKDVTGSHVFNEKDREFEFREGPVFTNILLADEINRAPPKTQSALLEAMEENQVTIDGETKELPDPFFVMATQNPVEQEGTFPLPEAQKDRFIIKTSMGYPDKEGMLELLERRSERKIQTPTADTVFTGDFVGDLQDLAEEVTVHPDLREYIVEFVQHVGEDDRVQIGISPRGTQRFFEVSRARAVLRGRGFVTPDDIKDVAEPSLAHRLILKPEARARSTSKRDVIRKSLDEVSVPTIENLD